MRMIPHFPDNRRVLAGLTLLTLLLLAASGCSEPLNAYRVSGESVAPDSRVLILPFMDTRTFVDPKDPYKDTLGVHARDIFIAAMREHPLGSACEILAPEMSRPAGSLTLAEVADFGRRHGADYVVSGQVFSFMDTRAASIPARAGMFVRIVSAHDGALAFVGDHYQSAPVPGAAGGRELQARTVSNRLIEGFVTGVAPDTLARRLSGSGKAMASIGPDNIRIVNGHEEELPPLPPLPPLPVVFGGEPDEDVWTELEAPAIPEVLEYDDFYSFEDDSLAAAVEPNRPTQTAADEKELEAASGESGLVDMMDEFAADAPAPPAPPPIYAEDAAEMVRTTGHEEAGSGAEEPVVADVAEMGGDREDLLHADAVEDVQPPAPSGIADDAPAVTAASVDESETADAAAALESVDEGRDEREDGSFEVAVRPESGEAGGVGLEADVPMEDADTSGPAEYAVEYADSFALKSGDELAADLFEEEMRDAMFALSGRNRTGSENFGSGTANAAAAVEAPATAEPAPAAPAEIEQPRPSAVEAVRMASSIAGAVLRPGFVLRPSPPAEVVADSVESIVVEQPRPVHMVDMVAAASDPAERRGRGVTPAEGVPGDVKVLFLPYHDRRNPNNLIENTGGGEVVTALFGARLAMEQGVQVMWPENWSASHERLAGIDEALRIGRLSGVDYVVRGQVVEFRRAQSVPSFYSAVISTAVLAAQMVFAEMSGVDIATEVYRVSDGMCVLSRRDRSHQKYVVQAEKTVRRLAMGAAASVAETVRDPAAPTVEPIIDGIEPATLFGNVL